MNKKIVKNEIYVKPKYIRGNLYIFNWPRYIETKYAGNDKIINYGSDNNIDYSIQIGEKIQIVAGDDYIIGTLHDIDVNEDAFWIKQKDGHLEKYYCKGIESIYGEQEINLINEI